jgi:hypothetical protein
MKKQKNIPVIPKPNATDSGITDKKQGKDLKLCL